MIGQLLLRMQYWLWPGLRGCLVNYTGCRVEMSLGIHHSVMMAPSARSDVMDPNSAPRQEAIILGLLAFFMALVVLSFFGSVLLNIVDAVFVCYALDRDTQTVSHPEVHEVFSQVNLSPNQGSPPKP